MMPESARPILKTTRNELLSADVRAGVSLTPLLTFRLGEQDYALLVDDVVEVAAMVEMTRIAGATAALPGIVNRHGQPLQLIDLRILFEQVVTPITAATLFIVVQSQPATADAATARTPQRAGLIVDEVLQVEYLPVTGTASATGAVRYIREIISQSHRLIQVVSLAALLKACLPDAPEV